MNIISVVRFSLPRVIPALGITLMLYAACGPALLAQEPGANLDTPQKKLSYAMGLDLAHSLKQADTEMDVKLLIMGLEDGFSGKPKLSPEEVSQVKQDFVKQRQTAQMEKMKTAGAKNQKEGDAFLAANKSKPGVKTTSSGLQYKVLTEGKGAAPKASDKVKVHYRGTLLDGTEFDSSYSRNQPAVFPLNGVIPGWTEGLQLMKVGGKSQLFVPAKLAYGKQGAGNKIGPDSTLIFEVELLEIQK